RALHSFPTRRSSDLAIRDNNPVVSFECSRLATLTGPVPDGDHLVPLGVADVKRTGTDVTLVGLAYYVRESLAVADELAREGISRSEEHTSELQSPCN